MWRMDGREAIRGYVNHQLIAEDMNEAIFFEGLEAAVLAIQRFRAQYVVDSAYRRLAFIDANPQVFRDRLQLVYNCQNCAQFLEEMQVEAPFDLWMNNGHGVKGYNTDNTQEFAAMLGLTHGNHSANAHTILTRYGLGLNNMQYMSMEYYREVWGISGIIRDSQSAVGFTIGCPYLFFKNALDIKNFGLSSAKAVLGIAYIQRQQFLLDRLRPDLMS